MKKLLLVLLTVSIFSSSGICAVAYIVSDITDFAQYLHLNDCDNIINVIIVTNNISLFDMPYYDYTHITRKSAAIVEGNGFCLGDEPNIEPGHVFWFPNAGFTFSSAGKTTFRNLEFKCMDSGNFDGALRFDNSDVDFQGIIKFSYTANLILTDNSTANFFTDSVEFFSNNGIGAGAVYTIDSNLNFNSTDVKFEQSGAVGYYNHMLSNEYRFISGGAIYAGSSTVNFNNCNTTFIYNHGEYSGGAIASNNSTLRFQNGTLNIKGNAVYPNKITYTENGIDYSYYNGLGGGIYSYSSNVNFNNIEGEIASNNALHGGAIYAEKSKLSFDYNRFLIFMRNYTEKFFNTDILCKGGAIFLSESDVNFNSSHIIFVENEAHDLGGAIYAEKSKIAFDTTKAIFSTNKAGFINYTTEEKGGAVYLSESELSFHNETADFNGNTATLSGGAMYIADNSTTDFNTSTVTFTGNAAGHSGGAISIASSTLTFDNTITAFSSNAAGLYGGAINAQNNKNIAFNGGTINFTSNSATSGGAVYADNSKMDFKNTKAYFIGNNAIDFGGAVCLTSSTLTVDNSTVTFFENYTMLDGGAINASKNSYIKFTNSDINFFNNISKYSFYGGAVYLSGSKLDFINSKVNFFDNVSSYAAGAIYIGEGAAVKFTNSNTIFNSNIATQSGGALQLSSGTATFTNGSTTFQNNKSTETNSYGGAIHAGNNSVINFESSTATFTGNSASNGGAIYASNANVKFNNSIVSFSDNKTFGNFGGAIYLSGSKFDVINSTVNFSNNTSSYTAGAMYITDGSTVNFTNSKTIFNSNISSIYGGALHINSSSITFSGGTTTFQNNKSTGTNNYGGAIYAQSGAQMSFSGGNVNFTSNSATVGGAISADNSTINFNNRNTIFDSNISSNYGGAIYANSGSLTFSGGTTTFQNNKSTDTENSLGGAIFSSNDARVNFKNGTVNFIGNTATNGGAIYTAFGGTVIFEDTTVNFINNVAKNAGGGIFILSQSTSSIVFKNSKLNFINNSSEYGGAIAYIYKERNPHMQIDFYNSIISFFSNTAIKDGGAISLRNRSVMDFENGTVIFSSNTASKNGGAVSVQYGSTISFMDLAILSFNNNIADIGGAVFISGKIENEITLSGSEMLINLYRNKNMVVNFKENHGKYGGAIFLQDDALVRLNGALKKVDKNGGTIEELNRINLNFLNNEATGDGGMLFAVDAMFDIAEAEAIFSENIAYDDGGAMYVLGYREQGSNILFSDTITHFINNSALNGNGGAIFIKNSSIEFEDTNDYISGIDQWVINNVNFSNNTSKQNGGAIYSDDSFINFDNGDVCFASNITQEKGGALFLSESNAFFEKNKMSVFKDNKAVYGDGGAIYLSTNSLLIFSDKVINENRGLGEINIIQFINNYASNNGGAIYSKNSDTLFNKGIVYFYNNKADRGSVIYATDGSRILLNNSGSILENNVSALDGGAFYVVSGSTVEFTEGWEPDYIKSTKAKNLNYYEMVNFINNSAGGNGGAIFSKDSEINFSEGIVTFNGNTAASGNGGGIFSENTAITFRNTLITFMNNKSLLGGAIYAESGSDVNFDTGNSLTFEGNIASGKGGAVYLNGGNINLTADTGEILFKNNTAGGLPNDIYADINSKLTFDTENYAIRLEGGILTDSGGTGIEINKTGSETLYFGGKNEIWGNFNISKGDIAMLAGASFKGDSLVIPSGSNLDMQNDSVNIIEVNTFESGDNLKMDIFYDGRSDTITAENMSLGGALDIKAEIGNYDNKEFEILISNGGDINGNFENITLNGRGLVFDVDPITNIVKIVVNGMYSSDFSSGRLGKMTFNQKETAHTLDLLSSTSTGELNQVISTALTLNNTEQLAFLSQVSGYFLANVIRGTLNASENKDIFARVSNGNKHEHNSNVWTQVNGEYTKYDEDENSLSDYKDIMTGIVAGYERYIYNNSLIAGAYGKYNVHDAKQSSKNRADIVNGGIGVYGGYITEKFELKALLAGSYDSYNTARYIKFTDKTAKSNFNAITVNADMEGIAKAAITDKFTINSYAGFEIQNTNYGSFEESGAGVLNLEVDDGNYTRSAGRIGVGAMYEGEDKKWNIYAKSEIKYLFMGGTVEIDSSFFGTKEKFQSRGYSENGFIYGFGLGGSVNLFKQADIFANANYFGAEGYSNIYANLGVKYAF